MTKPVSVFLHVRPVARRRPTPLTATAYSAEWVARGTGANVYTSRVCDTRAHAERLARSYLARNGDRLVEHTAAEYAAVLRVVACEADDMVLCCRQCGASIPASSRPSALSRDRYESEANRVCSCCLGGVLVRVGSES